MVRPEYIIFEVLMAVLFAACVWHASRQGLLRVVELSFGLIYGVFLEWMTLHQLHAYVYGRFLIMFDGAPLAIGLGWAVIIYSGMEFTRRVQLPEMARPLLDGLLALNIDLAMDTIAIRLGMWTWNGLSLDQQWFGVPWGNFWAWFIVVTSFSAFLRLFRLRGWHKRPLRRLFYVPMSFMLSTIFLYTTNRVFVDVLIPAGLDFAALAAMVAGSLLIIVLLRPRIAHAGPPDPVVIAVPFVFHVFFMVAGLVFGIYAQLPILAVLGVGMFLIGMALHLWPYLAHNRAPLAARSRASETR